MKGKIIFLICILLGIAGFVWYKHWRKDFLRKKIPNLVFLKSDSLYKISYSDIYIDEVEGEIIIKDLQLQPDTTYKRSTDPELPKNLLRVHVPELHITGVQTDAAILNKQIIATSLTLTQPVVTMYTNKGRPKADRDSTPATDSTPTTYEIYKVLLRGLQEISVDSIHITGANYHICKWISGDTVFSGKSIDAHLYHLNISDSTSTDTTRVLFAKQVDVKVDKIRIRDKKGFYRYILSGIQLHSTEKIFAIQSAMIAPMLKEAAFVRAAKWQIDRLNIDFTGIRFSGMNISRLLDGNLVADQMIVKDALFKVFRDKSFPSKPSRTAHAPSYPHQLFTNIPVVVAIQKMVIQHGYIEYKEKNPKTASSGKVQFNDVQATLYNVTNRDEDLKKNAVSTLHFRCRFLDKIPLSTTLQLYLGSKQGKFTARGTMQGVEASFFNNLTKPLALMMINSGNVNRLEFNLTGNNYSGTGTVLLLYDDLKVKLLKPGENGNEFETKGLASLLANVAIKNSNPVRNKPARVANVSIPRNDSKSMFNLLWKTIFAGVIKTVGIEGKIPL